VLLSVDGDSPNQYAFESVGGNISLMGIVDFAEIRPQCTEVTLAVHYEIKNKLFALARPPSAFCGQLCERRTAQHPRAFRGDQVKLSGAPARYARTPAGSRLTKRHSLRQKSFLIGNLGHPG
jgi:hypothetical protein